MTAARCLPTCLASVTTLITISRLILLDSTRLFCDKRRIRVVFVTAAGVCSNRNPKDAIGCWTTELLNRGGDALSRFSSMLPAADRNESSSGSLE